MVNRTSAPEGNDEEHVPAAHTMPAGELDTLPLPLTVAERVCGGRDGAIAPGCTVKTWIKGAVPPSWLIQGQEDPSRRRVIGRPIDLTLRYLERQVKRPRGRDGDDVPVIPAPAFDGRQIVGVIRPHHVLVGITVRPLVGAGGVVAVVTAVSDRLFGERLGVGAGAITERAQAKAAEEHAPVPVKNHASHTRRAIE